MLICKRWNGTQQRKRRKATVRFSKILLAAVEGGNYVGGALSQAAIDLFMMRHLCACNIVNMMLGTKKAK